MIQDVDGKFVEKRHKKKRKNSSGKDVCIRIYDGNLGGGDDGGDIVKIVELEKEAEEDIQYPYAVDPDDHCETPREAYVDISIFLKKLADKLKYDDFSALKIYDPFHCEGSMVSRLNDVGFKNVHNPRVDFYTSDKPQYDVLITNPPYSADHIFRILDFCKHSNKPYFLLLPNYCYMKEYYRSVSKSDMFYVSPCSRYQYTTPKGRRQRKSAKKTSPFPTFWYCNLGKHQECILREIAKDSSNSTFNLSKSVGSLPAAVWCETDARKIREKNSKKRKKHQERKRLTQKINN